MLCGFDRVSLVGGRVTADLKCSNPYKALGLVPYTQQMLAALTRLSGLKTSHSQKALWPPHSTEPLASICPWSSSVWSSEPHWSHLLSIFGIISACCYSSFVFLNKTFPVFLHSPSKSTVHSHAVYWVGFAEQPVNLQAYLKELSDWVK